MLDSQDESLFLKHSHLRVAVALAEELAMSREKDNPDSDRERIKSQMWQHIQDSLMHEVTNKLAMTCN